MAGSNSNECAKVKFIPVLVLVIMWSLSSFTEASMRCDPTEEGTVAEVVCNSEFKDRLQWSINRIHTAVTCSAKTCMSVRPSRYRAKVHGESRGSVLTITDFSRDLSVWGCSVDGKDPEECTIEAYVKAESPACTSPRVVGDGSRVAVTCGTDRVFPEAVCEFFSRNVSNSSWIPQQGDITYTHTRGPNIVYRPTTKATSYSSTTARPTTTTTYSQTISSTKYSDSTETSTNSLPITSTTYSYRQPTTASTNSLPITSTTYRHPTTTTKTTTYRHRINPTTTTTRPGTASSSYTSRSESSKKYFRSECTLEVAVTDLGQGPHTFRAVMYPDFVGSSPTTYGVTSGESGALTLSLPTAAINSSCPQGSDVIDGYIKSGTQASCRCDIADLGNPPGRVTWHNSTGQEVGTQSTGGTHSLIDTVFSSTSSGSDYTCQADSPLGQGSRVTFQPKMAYGPTAVYITTNNYNESVDLCPGEVLSVTCSVALNTVNPAPLFTILLDDSALISRRVGSRSSTSYGYTHTVSPSGGDLRVTCRVDNSKFSDLTAEVTDIVKVREPPTKPRIVVQTSRGGTLYAGNDITVMCFADGGFPLVRPSDITLTCTFKDGLTVDAGKKGTIFMPSVTLDVDGAQCTCTADHISKCHPEPAVVTLVIHDPESSSSTNYAAIGGGVAGGTALIILVIIIIVFIRRKGAGNPPSHDLHELRPPHPGGRLPDPVRRPKETPSLQSFPFPRRTLARNPQDMQEKFIQDPPKPPRLLKPLERKITKTLFEDTYSNDNNSSSTTVPNAEPVQYMHTDEEYGEAEAEYISI